MQGSKGPHSCGSTAAAGGALLLDGPFNSRWLQCCLRMPYTMVVHVDAPIMGREWHNNLCTKAWGDV